MGINNLPEDALTAIAQEVEYRARELVQDASKFARHEHRDKLLVDDLNYALKARNLEVDDRMQPFILAPLWIRFDGIPHL